MILGIDAKQAESQKTISKSSNTDEASMKYSDEVQNNPVLATLFNNPDIDDLKSDSQNNKDGSASYHRSQSNPNPDSGIPPELKTKGDIQNFKMQNFDSTEKMYHSLIINQPNENAAKQLAPISETSENIYREAS